MRAFCTIGIRPLDIIGGNIVTGSGSSTGDRGCAAGWISHEGLVWFHEIQP